MEPLTVTLVLLAVVIVSVLAGIGLGEVLWELYRLMRGRPEDE